MIVIVVLDGWWIIVGLWIDIFLRYLEKVYEKVICVFELVWGFKITNFGGGVNDKFVNDTLDELYRKSLYV